MSLIFLCFGLGGFNSDGSSEFYNFDTNQWTFGPSLVGELSYGASVPYKNSFLLVAGQNNGYVDSIIFYNPETQEFEELDESIDIGRLSNPAVMIAEDVVPCT